VLLKGHKFYFYQVQTPAIKNDV